MIVAQDLRYICANIRPKIMINFVTVITVATVVTTMKYGARVCEKFTAVFTRQAHVTMQGPFSGGRKYPVARQRRNKLVTEAHSFDESRPVSCVTPGWTSCEKHLYALFIYRPSHNALGDERLVSS